MKGLVLVVTAILIGPAQVSSQDARSHQCDPRCESILVEAGEWGLEAAAGVPGSDTASTFIAVRLVGPSAGDLEGRMLEVYEDSLSHVISDRLGVPMADRRRHPDWQACREAGFGDPIPADCRAAAGTTYISIADMQFDGETQASVWVSILVIRSEQHFTRGSQLMLEFVNDEWVVTEVRITVG